MSLLADWLKRQMSDQKPLVVSDGEGLVSLLGKRPKDQPDYEGLDSGSRAFYWVFSTMIILFLIWINIGTLDIVSMTQGEVTPSSQVKSIQHLEGGIVEEILIQEGEKVTKGQELVVLENVGSIADVSELEVRLNSLAIDIVRLEAEAVGAELPVFGAEQNREFGPLVAQAIERFQSRKKTHRSKLNSQRQIIQQRQSEIEEIGARLHSRRSSMKLLNEQIVMSTDLLKDGLTTKYDHLALLQKGSDLNGEIKADEAALQRSKAALAEAESQLENIRSSYMDDVREELDKNRLEYRELSERLKKFKDSLTRTVLRSPVDGVIKTLYVATIGGVVKPGDSVVDIVPGDDRLVIEAKLPTTDIGYVQVGQEAIVKLTSSDAARYGSLDGLVKNVSPDTLVSQDGVPYYKVLIETERSFFQRGQWRYQLYPGMQVMANIRTGERTVFEYLFDPIIAGMGDSLQER